MTQSWAVQEIHGYKPRPQYYTYSTFYLLAGHLSFPHPLQEVSIPSPGFWTSFKFSLLTHNLISTSQDGK